jgi:malonyl-CoA/methylmalonyl-CoA synthetase
VVGLFEPLRVGGHVEHVGRFSPEALAAAARRGATMIFGVPTMYRRVADACEQDNHLAAALAHPRLLVSGSATLPAYEHRRIQSLTTERSKSPKA